MSTHKTTVGLLTGVVLGAALLTLAGPALAAPVTLFNTGVNGVGTPLPGGSVDPHWSVVAGPSIVAPVPAVVLLDQSPLGLYAQDVDSRWIWVEGDGTAAVGEPYTFRLTFDLTGLDPATAVITGRWGVDNTGFIRLNGSTAGIGSGELSLPDVLLENFTAFHDFTLDSGFVAGINTLEFVATDDSNPGGLNVNDLVGTANTVGPPVPEPSALVPIGVGAVAVLAYCWRRVTRGA
jgi:hypothetical protein